MRVFQGVKRPDLNILDSGAYNTLKKLLSNGEREARAKRVHFCHVGAEQGLKHLRGKVKRPI
jgi:hypothetical protein